MNSSPLKVHSGTGSTEKQTTFGVALLFPPMLPILQDFCPGYIFPNIKKKIFFSFFEISQISFKCALSKEEKENPERLCRVADYKHFHPSSPAISQASKAEDTSAQKIIRTS